MSIATKSIIALLLIVVAGVGVWKSGMLGTPPAQEPVTQQTTTPQAEEPQYGMSANNDASDQALAQDSAALDTQIQAMQSDSASVDSSMNDKSLPQSY